MKNLPKIIMAIALITILVSCQETPSQLLSNEDSKREIMATIARDSSLSREMMGAIMTSENGMMMMEHKSMMVKMMKDHPEMMPGMMSDMMDVAQSDTSMMSEMYKTMMQNSRMKDMMQKMKNENKNMKKMEGMENKN